MTHECAHILRAINRPGLPLIWRAVIILNPDSPEQECPHSHRTRAAAARCCHQMERAAR